MRNQRKKVWLEGYQTWLFLRLGAYWIVYQLTVLNFTFAWRMLAGGEGSAWEEYVGMLRDNLPTLICFLLLVPILAWDAVRFSHRVVGPLVPMRRAMQTIAQGGQVAPIRLRQGDFLQEMKDDFNAMLADLERRGADVLLPAPSAAEKSATAPEASLS